MEYLVDYPSHCVLDRGAEAAGGEEDGVDPDLGAVAAAVAEGEDRTGAAVALEVSQERGVAAPGGKRKRKVSRMEFHSKTKNYLKSWKNI